MSSRPKPLLPRRESYNQLVIASSQPVSLAAFSAPPSPETLLIDADDTLWENNVYFERAIMPASYSYLDHRVHSPEEVRGHLNKASSTPPSAPTALRSPTASAGLASSPVSSSSPTSPSPKKSIAASKASPIGPSPTRRWSSSPASTPPSPTSPPVTRLILMTKGNQEEQTDKLSTALWPRAALHRRRGHSPKSTPKPTRAITAHHGCVALHRMDDRQ